MLQAAKALMYSNGFRPSGIGHHATIIEFASIVLDNKYSEIIEVLDTMRRKRNTAIYDTAGLISQKEATEAIRNARYLVKEMVKILE
ncbi:MAG: HEPN domain-containing protein [Actinomycetota bacterium]|nr:HEPN domain-containing protein [Actinomycetota bacterium]